MTILPTPISGVTVVETAPVVDRRGSLSRLFCETELASILGGRRIVQINHSITRQRGAVRGMHLQVPPHAEMKLVRCISGSIWDVAVDLRHGSPTLLRWHGEEINDQNARMLVIPEGCAHGFQVLEGPCELIYLHTASYRAQAERAVSPDDPQVGIRWPLAISELSDRDRTHAPLPEAFPGIVV